VTPVRELYSYRADPAVPSFPDDRPIVIFDGQCVFCSAFAAFILRKDRSRRFRIAAAQNPVGAALYRHFGLDPNETNVLLDGGRAYLRSDSSLRIFALLGLPWSIVGWARLLPRGMRDTLYGIVARNRFRWFGARATCYLPAPSEVDRFLV